jgi:hypothetical protein
VKLLNSARAQSAPGVRLGGARIGALLLVVIAAVLLVSAACLIDVERGRYVPGRSLTVGVTQIRKLDAVGYHDPEKNIHYRIAPKDPERNILAVASVTVRNDRSARVALFVDTKAAYVDDSANQRYQVMDPFNDRSEVQEAVKDENIYLPFMWGTIDLKENTQVTGWMFFEIPKEQRVVRFGWGQGENIVVRFEEP